MTGFSIIVPAFNAAETLAETLDAIFAQTQQDWACVIVDDGSTDSTLEIASSYSRRDERFTVISQENRGTGGAYNTGIRASSGEWITICSADDVLLPSHVATMSTYADKYPGSSILTCNGYLWSSNSDRHARYTQDWSQETRVWTFADLLGGCYFGVGACYRRQVFDATGGYAEHVFGEDYDFWLRAAALGFESRYVPEILSAHRISSSQKSSDLSRTFASDISTVKRIMRTFDLNPDELAAARGALRKRRAQSLRARLPFIGAAARFARRAAGILVHPPSDPSSRGKNRP